MSFRLQIQTQFLGKAFERPLFYSYPTGLRFELSEGGSFLEQFLTALRKATEICTSIFTDNIVVCLQVYNWQTNNRFAYRSILRGLAAAGICIPKEKEIWLEQAPETTGEPLWWVHVAFQVPKSLLPNLLWCAVARDFSSIQPNPGCQIYLFDLQNKLMALPYDDRGMDVVGENLQALKLLYTNFVGYLLEYDRQKMDAIFGA
jgi:hypothetical protein